MHAKVLGAFVALGILLEPLAQAATDKRKQADDDVGRAVAFERHKERAAERQARLEARHPSVRYTNPNAERSSDGNGAASEKRQQGSRQKSRPQNRE